MVYDRDLFQNPIAFAHEIGHILALEHTMYPAQSRNPEKPLADVQWGDSYDFWDLVYGVNEAGQPVGFNSRQEAQTFPGTLIPKHDWVEPNGPSSCTVDGNCTLQCLIGGQTVSNGDALIKGLAFQFPGDSPTYLARVVP